MASAPNTTNSTNRAEIKRLPKRGDYSRETLYAILDEGLMCHVGFVSEGQPFVIPTGYGRSGHTLYLHGSAMSRMLRTLAEGIEACVTVTLLDGLVLARSAFHHSMNYRSAVLFGSAKLIQSEAEKLRALRTITEHIVPGRWSDTRHPRANELKATTVLSFEIDEASSKVRVGPPIDDENDYGLDVWAGVLPLSLVPGSAVNDPRLKLSIETPGYVLDYKRRSIE